MARRFTKDEIADIQASYRGAKNKKRQIGILAQLNLCSKEEIEKILGLGEEDPDDKLPKVVFEQPDEKEGIVHITAEIEQKEGKSVQKEVGRVRARKPQKEEKEAAVPREMDMEEILLLALHACNDKAAESLKQATLYRSGAAALEKLIEATS